ncbi:DUF2087 domain-containing protein [Archangium violaceum]|uniref:DUF2087 domain-containing protein n=1 Tax=Archangium violaceum TaxID=83451 RepID=UPI00193BFF31|nr:DUF2087 domain-containing protein [Archangium violaceum]QRK07511.1 DUF2087 domain-containing protein [Archangium violaceum]
MSRLSLPYAVADISALARSLRDQLGKLGHMPGHVELLNMLARSAGYANYQHLRAQLEAQSRLAAPRAPTPAPDHERIEKVARHFDDSGRLLRWPARANQQELCLWVLWSRIPSGKVFTEQQINELLKHWHLFGDHALLRRSLFDFRLVARTTDGRQYRRIEQKPPAELSPLIEHLNARTAT